MDGGGGLGLGLGWRPALHGWRRRVGARVRVEASAAWEVARVWASQLAYVLTN